MQAGSAPADVSPEHGVATLEQAVARMVTLDGEFPLGDGVRYFNSLYLEVTREVVRRLSAGELEDPRFLERLAVCFSNAYFGAVADFAHEPASGASRAWAPLFAARFDRRVAPIQFALAGMNAHINYDLPTGVRDACRALDLTPEDGSPQHRDYMRLNAILEDVQERVKPWLTPGLLGVIDRAFGRLDDVVAAFSVARARDAAWVHAKTLWLIRDERELSSSYLLALDRMVGFAGRGLLAPTLLGLARWSSAQEWLPGAVRWLLGAPRGGR
jgi:hypothetical protein